MHITQFSNYRNIALDFISAYVALSVVGQPCVCENLNRFLFSIKELPLKSLSTGYNSHFKDRSKGKAQEMVAGGDG